jgi:hypothetical protein
MRAEVPPRRTYPGTRAAWVQTRFAALVAALDRRALPPDLACAAARAVLVHLIRETGWGRAEWNFAAGNIKCAGWAGDCHRLVHADGSTALYRAYASLAEGIEDYVRLLEGRRYRPAWVYLLTPPHDGVGWYDQLMRRGYHPWSTDALREYVAIGRDLRALATAQPSTWRFLDGFAA